MRFKNFEGEGSGTVITHQGNYCVVRARNPYGSHSLVLLTQEGEEWVSIRHGKAVVFWTKALGLEKLYKKLLKKGFFVEVQEVNKASGRRLLIPDDAVIA